MHDDVIFTPPAKRRLDLWGYGFFMPAFLLMALFLFYPAILAIVQSVKQCDTAVAAGSFGGIRSYIQQMKSPAFWRAILNTMYFAAVYVPGTLAAGYLVASLINRTRMRRQLIMLFFIPAILPATVTGTIWAWMYEPTDGVIAVILNAFGLTSPHWLREHYLALGAIAVVCIWQSAGVIAAVFMAASNALPAHFDDMARLDGLSALQRFIHTRLGPMRNAFIVCTVLPMINVYRVFGVILVITGDGGPANWTTNLPFLVFRRAMLDFEFGAASATAIMLCFSIGILVVLLRRFPVPAKEF